MRTGLTAATLAAASLCMGGAAQAAENWWPVKVYNYDSGKQDQASARTEMNKLPTPGTPTNECFCLLHPHAR